MVSDDSVFFLNTLCVSGQLCACADNSVRVRQLSAAATELVGDAQYEQEVEAANLAKKMIAAVIQASSGKLAPGTYTSIPATSEPMLFECIEAHTAGNGSQLSVPVGGTVLVQKLHEGMLEAQLVNEGTTS